MDKLSLSKPSADRDPSGNLQAAAASPMHIKFKIFGEEMITKQVKQSGSSGRVYLPRHWVGKQVKIVRID